MLLLVVSPSFFFFFFSLGVFRICVGTWNVGGQIPPDDLDIDGWLDINDPADIYVIGYVYLTSLLSTMKIH